MAFGIKLSAFNYTLFNYTPEWHFKCWERFIVGCVISDQTDVSLLLDLHCLLIHAIHTCSVRVVYVLDSCKYNIAEEILDR